MTHKTWYPWVAWGLPALSFMVMYVARVAPAVLFKDMSYSFAASHAAMGSLSSAFMLAYILMQLPSGVLADRFGPVRLLLVSSMVAMLGNVLFSMATTLLQAYIARFILGMGSACIFVCALTQAKIWAKPHYFVVLCGLTKVGGTLGAALGSYALRLCEELVGWRVAVLGISLVWCALWIPMGIFLRSKKLAYPAQSGLTPFEDLMQGFLSVLRHKDVWRNGLYAGCIYLPVGVLGEWWGNYYLSLTHKLSASVAASVMASMFIGLALGGSFMGYLAHRYQAYRIAMTISALLSLPLLLLGMYWRSCPIFLLHGIYFLLGIGSSGLMIAYALSSTFTPARVSASAMAFANMMSIALSALLQPLIGWSVFFLKPHIGEVMAFESVMGILPLGLLYAWYLATRMRLPEGYH